MDTVKLLDRLFTVFEQDILPKTRAGIAQGIYKFFGAAILKKSDLSVVVAETNNDTENPLWHGELYAIKKLYDMEDRANFPDPKDCIFLTTHEPCSLCLSAITWGGYDNFYYLFSHKDTHDRFNIPQDIQILREVFGDAESSRPLYNRSNAFWHSYSIPQMIDSLEDCDSDRESLLVRMRDFIALYIELLGIYRVNKRNAAIPLA